MVSMQRLALASVIAIGFGGAPAWAQGAKDLVGTWQLVSNVVTVGDKKTDQFGPKPHGILYFESNGHYVLSIMRDGLPKYAGKGREHATAEEAHATVAGAQHHQRFGVAHEHQRLDDLADFAAERRGGLGGRAGRVGHRDDVDGQAVIGQAALQSCGRGMHALRNLIPWRA